MHHYGNDRHDGRSYNSGRSSQSWDGCDYDGYDREDYGSKDNDSRPYSSGEQKMRDSDRGYNYGWDSRWDHS